MPEIKETYHPKNINQWRNWLIKNHKKKDSIFLVRYKKHTGKPSWTHGDAMKEAICFGWIDTTMKRVDEDKSGIFFVKRKKNAGWSKNTLSYAKKLLEEGKMFPQGIEAYERALKKPTIDHNLPRNPDIPKDLMESLEKSKKAKENFNKFAPSYRRYYIWWIERAKRPETRNKRIKEVVKKSKNNLKQ